MKRKRSQKNMKNEESKDDRTGETFEKKRRKIEGYEKQRER